MKRLAAIDGSLNGVYVPYWTYDCETTTDYVGQRGEVYSTTETYTTTVNGRPQRVYLPVSTPKLPPAAPAKPYKLTVIPPVELREVYVTVAENANRAKPLRDHVALKYGSYSANQKIEIDLPALAKPGLYVVEVSGDRRDQGSVTTGPFLIHHVQ